MSDSHVEGLRIDELMEIAIRAESYPDPTAGAEAADAFSRFHETFSPARCVALTSELHELRTKCGAPEPARIRNLCDCGPDDQSVCRETGAMPSYCRIAAERKAESGIPLPSAGLTWEQFWARVRQIDFNPSPSEFRAALKRYEDRECPHCHKQLKDDEIFGSCMHMDGGVHRRMFGTTP